MLKTVERESKPTTKLTPSQQRDAESFHHAEGVTGTMTLYALYLDTMQKLNEARHEIKRLKGKNHDRT